MLTSLKGRRRLTSRPSVAEGVKGETMSEKQRVERVAAAGRPLRKRWLRAAQVETVALDALDRNLTVPGGVISTERPELNGVPALRGPVPREAPASEVEGVVTNMTTHRPALAAPS